MVESCIHLMFVWLRSGCITRSTINEWFAIRRSHESVIWCCDAAAIVDAASTWRWRRQNKRRWCRWWRWLLLIIIYIVNCCAAIVVVYRIVVVIRRPIVAVTITVVYIVVVVADWGRLRWCDSIAKRWRWLFGRLRVGQWWHLTRCCRRCRIKRTRYANERLRVASEMNGCILEAAERQIYWAINLRWFQLWRQKEEKKKCQKTNEKS